MGNRVKTKVLVTDPTYKHSLGVCRSLAKAGFEVHTIGQGVGLTRFSSSVTKVHNISENPPNLVGSLIDVVDKENISLILPVGARSVEEISSNRDLLSGKVSFALAPKSSIEIGLDKVRTIKKAEEIGVSVPKTWVFENQVDFIRELQNVPLPLVVKGAGEIRKFPTVYIETIESRSEFILKQSYLTAFLDGPLVVQSKIEGKGMGFFALYQNGGCVRMFMHQRLRELPATGGASWAAKGIYSQSLMDQGVALLDSLEWHGPAMVEFKQPNDESDAVLMEVNPKFWGSLDLAIASGVDFPSDTCRVAMGEKLDKNFDYIKGINYVWPLENLSGYLGDSELRGMKYRTNIVRHDLLPSLYQIFESQYSSFMRRVTMTVLGKMVFWIRKYSLGQFFSRFVGEIMGIPLPLHCKIDENLYIGAKPSWIGMLALKTFSVTKVICLLDKSECRKSTRFTDVIHLPLAEFVEIPHEQLLAYVHKIRGLREDKEKIFIHCREGVGRAPSVAAGILISEGVSLFDALKNVRAGRNVSDINSLQMESLDEFESKFKSS